MNQTLYDEAESMQNQHYQNESAFSHEQYNLASNLESNSTAIGEILTAAAVAIQAAPQPLARRLA
jgi:hypothetical protein